MRDGDPERMMRTLRFACQSSRRAAHAPGEKIAMEGDDASNEFIALSRGGRF